MSSVAQTARMVLRAPEARTPAAIRRPAAAQRAARSAAAVPVSQPQEPSEREAERVARRALALPPRVASVGARRLSAALPARASASTGTPALPAALALSAASGRPLPAAVRRDMEPRFGADFSGVRVHNDDAAARASRRIQAAAFTVGNHVFFGRGRYQPQAEGGRQLLAHELTHTIQQRGAAQQAGPIARMPELAVRERSAPRVQRLGIQDALDYFADKAAFLPGFTMLTLLLGFNPISLREVARTPANLLRALIQLLPGGALVTQALDNHGIVERVAAWAEAQLSALGDFGASIREAIDAFLDGLSWTDIFDLAGVWDRARRIVTGPIDRIIVFGRTLVGGIVDFIKDAILRPIGRLADGTRGYPLLKAVLGFDPVTGDPVPRDAATLIGGFMTLIGQQEVWANIQRANAIPRAWAWFQGAVSGYLGFVTQIPSQFLQAFRSLELVDIIIVPRAFARIAGVFLSIYGRFFSWAVGTVISLLEIIIEAVAPGALPYLRQAGAAFQTILRNPIGFGMNLVRAAKAGLMRFAGNFLVHLQAGLIDWLTGSLPGVHIPRALSLPEILRFVMSVLGLTWANLRVKLVRQVGEPAMVAMEKGFEIVVTLVRDGPVAAWEQMKDSLAELKQMAIQGIVEMVVQMVVVRALPKLIALFIPGPGFITAAIAIWDTIVTFMRQLGRIAALVKSYLDAIIAIASGNIDAAAQRVEAAAARYLSLIISILAGIVGFGKVSTRVQAVLERIRRPIDAALDRVVAWVVAMARKGFERLASLASSKAGLPPVQVQLDSAVAATEKAIAADPLGAIAPSQLAAIQRQFGLKRLETVRVSQGEVQVDAEINPRKRGRRILDNRQRLNDCIKAGLHGKSVRIVSHGNPKRVAAVEELKLAQLRRNQEALRRVAARAETRLIAQERLARARGIPESGIPEATNHARDAFQRALTQLQGVDGGIAGIEYEQRVAAVIKPDLRSVVVHCTNCDNRIAEFDMIKDKTVFETKISVSLVKVDQVKVEQDVAAKLWGKVEVVLVLPAGDSVEEDVAKKKAVAKKFADQGEPVPEVRLLPDY